VIFPGSLPGRLTTALDPRARLCSNAGMRLRHLPLLVPGTAFWVLVIVGIATGSAAVWFATVLVGLATFLGFVVVVTSKSAEDL
jgi:hypothetical protein